MKALNEKMRNQKAANDFLVGHEPTPMEVSVNIYFMTV